MTLITFEDGKAVMRDGKIGTEQACCCDQAPVCENCFVSFSGVYAFTFDGTCNGTPVNIAGFLTDGLYFNVPQVVTLICTQYSPCAAGLPVSGMAISVSDANCTWESIIPGNIDTVCPEDQVTPVGSYTLTNCADNTGGLLVIS